MAYNLSVAYSTRPEVVTFAGRISGTGQQLSPLSGPRITISHVANSGVYALTVTTTFAEYLYQNCNVNQANAFSSTNNLTYIGVWNPTLNQYIITVSNINTTAAPSVVTPATDAQITEIGYLLSFADSRVP